MITLTVTRSYVKIYRSATDQEYYLASEIRGLIVKETAILLLIQGKGQDWVTIPISEIETYNGASGFTVASISGDLMDCIGASVIDTSGARGGKYIVSGDGEVTIDNVGFVSWDDATVVSVVTIGGANVVDTTYNLGTIVIPKGSLVTWGAVATSIRVSAGGGWILKG